MQTWRVFAEPVTNLHVHRLDSETCTVLETMTGHWRQFLTKIIDRVNIFGFGQTKTEV